MTNDSPDTMHKLRELARNLWWSWQPDIRAIFRELDPEVWKLVYHNPVALLQRVPDEEIARRVNDLEMQTRIDQAYRRLKQYLAGGESWGTTHAGPLLAHPVAYFSAEFGIHQSLPIYSGGLGVLAGDHLKSTSDLGVPVVGIGLLYHEGYVHQLIDEAGWQQDSYEPIGSAELPADPLLGADGAPLRVSVELPGRTVQLRLWHVWVGRSRLLLLDARDEANSPEDQELTARLYGGDQETRIQQEILLGVGGFRALGAVGIHPSVLHLNEGHSAFALLEWARHKVEREGLDPADALREVAAAGVFTTHTPVEAGHDRFRLDLAGPHLEPLAAGLGISLNEVLALGSERPGDPASTFCPTVLALRLSRRTNGVSALHGRVSRRMWHHLYPGRPEEEVPIGHITNGVHVRTWMAADMHGLLVQYLGPDWLDSICRPGLYDGIDGIPDAELWEVHQVLKARLFTFVRRRLADRRERLRMSEPKREPLLADALTLGFARRFATYKRADILFHDLDRLDRLINHPERPLQIVFAGKAHPRDTGGKALAQRVANLERDERFAGRIVFVENYSMHVGRQLVQGVDVWLNNPRRPQEASGTSGEKCILNGVLNCSILDGWWAEGYDGSNGFAVGHGEIHKNPDIHDQRDAEALFETLEREVVPLYYDRDAEGIPRAWIRRVKRAIRTLAWRYNADRMVKDYVEECYLPAAGAETCRMPGA
ncbi:MAG TPA: alpha-glucan family phosphorylase [Thermoanaerobaculia bacterium]|jgi:starch phosphorylase|nr:alpha-glucan family phosphorylase [Thermoanaerobaculia bacterium]